eukprot:1285407-Rhodomonas_salina.1
MRAHTYDAQAQYQCSVLVLHAMRSTNAAYCLCACYPMRSTNTAYGGTGKRRIGWSYGGSVRYSTVGLTAQCGTVLVYGVVCYALGRTDDGHAGTRCRTTTWRATST